MQSVRIEDRAADLVKHNPAKNTSRFSEGMVSIGRSFFMLLFILQGPTCREICTGREGTQLL